MYDIRQPAKNNGRHLESNVSLCGAQLEFSRVLAQVLAENWTRLSQAERPAVVARRKRSPRVV